MKLLFKMTYYSELKSIKTSAIRFKPTSPDYFVSRNMLENNMKWKRLSEHMNRKCFLPAIENVFASTCNLKIHGQYRIYVSREIKTYELFEVLARLLPWNIPYHKPSEFQKN